MSSHVFNEFKRALAAGEIDLDSDDIRVILCMTNTTADTENDAIAFVGDLTTLDECDATNYARKALANQAVAVDDTNDRATFDADDVTWASLGADGTRDIAGALIYLHVTNDADSIPCFWVEFSATPDGNDFEIQWHATDKIAYLS